MARLRGTAMTQSRIRLCKKQYPCPCCGYMSFEEPPGSYNICPICFWEDDAVQLAFPYSKWPNLPLVEAQKNYAEFGATRDREKRHVRPPMEEDLRDPEWRQFDPAIDVVQIGPQDG